MYGAVPQYNDLWQSDIPSLNMMGVKVVAVESESLYF